MTRTRFLAAILTAGTLLTACNASQATTSVSRVTSSTTTTTHNNYGTTPSAGYTSGYDSNYFSNQHGLFVETTSTTSRVFIPYAGNGGGPTQCADGTWSNSSGRGTCSHHGGVG